MLEAFLHLRSLFYYLAIGCIGIFIACQPNDVGKRFQFLSPNTTGIYFSNDIITNDTFNILNFHYIYNGGGVGVGDFDKNGLPDLVFSGNQVSSKLYLNQKNLKFKDVSEIANIQTTRWTTGVSVVDINSDGWEDIYISVGGLACDGECENYLFINQGLDEDNIPIFKESAEEYGLNDGLYTQQAAFFDYDNDGDLDVYLLRNAINPRDKNAPNPKRFISETSQDVLLRNEKNTEGILFFEDVSAENNINHRGYGLGVTINDFNLDGRPDIYVANDFLSEDLLYLKKRSGGFEEVSKDYLKHTSYNAMGVDVADLNNDGLPEIMVLDMLPETQERKKSMQGFMNYNKFALSTQRGYTPQFIRNTLQLHNGFLGGELLPFSEVSHLSNVYNTDWSWAPLLADFDNDGDRDIYVTNGYGKDITDLDFINYSQNISQFGTKESLAKKLAAAVDQMKNVKIPNYFFENTGNLNFKNQSNTWIKEQPSISNGAVYTDLDNDGDLDIVTNNINQKAFVLENKTTGNNYLKIKLKGPKSNVNAIGAILEICTGGDCQKYFQSPVKGYLSSVDPILHFGLGTKDKVDKIKVQWYLGTYGRGSIFSNTNLENISVNQTLIIDYNKGERLLIGESDIEPYRELFRKKEVIGLQINHQENFYRDFDFQPLLLKQFSKQGPCFAVANIDGKKGDELFIGGAKGIPGKIYFEQLDGSYASHSLPDSMSEDTDATFLDIDKDGDLDLYVVSGGSEFLWDDPKLQDRVYLNNGKGDFYKSDQYQSPVNGSGGIVAFSKRDKNGDSYVFVGGRLVPGKYPTTPNSELLINKNSKLEQDSNNADNDLRQVGMVTDAIFSDYNQDEKEDLIVTTEWGGIEIFEKGGSGLFKKIDMEIYLATDTNALIQPKGFWSAIKAGDFDKDGDMDYLLGNLGENTNLKATINEPLYLYKEDYDENGGMDPLVGHFYSTKEGNRKSFPIHARDDVVKQLVKVKSRFQSYAEFGKATLAEILPSAKIAEDYLSVNFLKSSYLENKGNGRFILHALPLQAQLGPIQAILVEDFDKDGNLDALLVGNDYSAESSGGQQDAFNGLFLKGNGQGGFKAISTAESGFLSPKDGREIISMTNSKGKKIILVGQNEGNMLIFTY